MVYLTSDAKKYAATLGISQEDMNGLYATAKKMTSFLNKEEQKQRRLDRLVEISETDGQTQELAISEACETTDGGEELEEYREDY